MVQGIECVKGEWREIQLEGLERGLRQQGLLLDYLNMEKGGEGGGGATNAACERAGCIGMMV